MTKINQHLRLTGVPDFLRHFRDRSGHTAALIGQPDPEAALVL